MYVNFLSMRDALLLRLSDLRVREVNLVYEYTLNEKRFSSAMLHVHRPFASFPNLRVIQNAMVRVQMKRVRYQKLSSAYGSLKHASTTLADRLCQSRLAKAVSPKLTSAPFPSSSLV